MHLPLFRAFLFGGGPAAARAAVGVEELVSVVVEVRFFPISDFRLV